MSSTSIDSFETIPSKVRQLNDKVIILYFFMVGGGMSLGWYATSNSYNYYEVMFPSYNVTFVFPLAVYTSQFLSILTINKICSLIPYHTQMLLCLITNILIVVFLSIQAHLFQGNIFGMCLSMLLLFCLGFSNNLGYASAIGLTSMIEPRYTVYAMMGVSFFGLMGSSLKALVLWIFSASSDGDLTPTLIYYLVITSFILATLALHIIFMRSEFYFTRCLASTETSDATVNLLEENVTRRQLPKRDLKTLLAVFKQVKFYLFLIFVLYIQMDITFPGVMLKKPMPGIASHTKTVSMMTTFTICLLIGKKLSQYKNHYSIKTVIVVIICRFALNAFFILQAVATSLPVFDTIWFGFFNVILFGITSGFTNVALFILAAGQVIMSEKEPAGFLCVFTANVGAIVGGFSALPLKNIGPS